MISLEIDTFYMAESCTRSFESQSEIELKKNF